MPIFEIANLSGPLTPLSGLVYRFTVPVLLGVAVIALLLLLRYGGLRWMRAVENGMTRFARLPLPLLALLCFVWGFGVAASIWMFVRRPVPHVHDEASYLLAADTFAHGRWTNPALPADIAAHFEALHIIVSPSYMSKYPPGQGLMLALGILIGDRPAIGLWINAGLVCAAALYGLLPFVPRRWAVSGALLAALHPAVLKWTQTYWGGNLALFAALLLIGAIGRLAQFRHAPRSGPRVRDAVLLGVALAVLANSRPFEGLVGVCVCALPLVPVFFRGLRQQAGIWLARFVLPLVGVLAVTAALMVTYNVRVTGKPLRMPYAVHEDRYGVVPLFLWQKVKPVPPTLRHDTMRFINARECVYGYWGERDSLRNLWNGVGDKIEMLARGGFQLFDPAVYWLDALPQTDPVTEAFRFVPALLLLPGLLVALSRHDRTTRYAVFGLLLFGVIVLQETFMNPHYGAPVGGLVLLVWVQAWRHLRVMALRRARGLRSNRRAGLAVGRMALLGYLASAVGCVQAFASPQWDWLIQDRRPVIEALHQRGGKDLVLVYYGPVPVMTSAEWVYNRGDLSAQKIVWARYLTDAENANLIRHFPGRKVWLLDVQRRNRPHLYAYDPKLMRGLPFPPPRVADPQIVARLRRGLPTRPKGVSGIAALSPAERAAYHRGVALRSSLLPRWRQAKEIPLSLDPNGLGSPERFY